MVSRATNDSDVEALVFQATETDASLRLDAFLSHPIDGWSRARLQKLIEDGDVLVNGRTVKPAYNLRNCDQIEVELTPSAANFTPEDLPLDIIHEDNDIIVVNKAAG